MEDLGTVPAPDSDATVCLMQAWRYDRKIYVIHINAITTAFFAVQSANKVVLSIQRSKSSTEFLLPRGMERTRCVIYVLIKRQ